MIKKYIKKYGLTVLFIILLFLFAYFKTWWGVGGIFLFITILQIVRVVVFFKSVPWLKELMLDHIKKWEAAQLGYDLDDPYWDSKKRPTRWQKLMGINPNDTDADNKRRKEINKDLARQLSFKQKYLSLFDYKTGSKAIYLLVSISLSIWLIKIGWNILLVFALIFLLGGVKKLIDKKYSN